MKDNRLKGSKKSQNIIISPDKLRWKKENKLKTLVQGGDTT